MDNSFFKQPILNSPYEYPKKHWELDDDGQPTHEKIYTRRKAEFITPIPKPRKRRTNDKQGTLVFDEGLGLSTQEQKYDPTPIINALRKHVDEWREIPNPDNWKVTPETARLLQHWRHHKFSGIRPFFCQVEAVETLIWLTEVAPKTTVGKKFLDHIHDANLEANPELSRIALKLATGAGKTTVMAMIIAWQTINAVRRPSSRNFTRGFLIVAPGITIKDRLRVLKPNDPDSYFKSRELVPVDMIPDLGKAIIVITNYHAFKLRERIDLSRGGRSLLQGQGGDDLKTTETEGQMIQRVMQELMGLKSIMAINDEAHHCYREKPTEGEEEIENLKGDEKDEAKKNNEAARLWISGLEAVNRKLGLAKVIDLSATPFFLKGSGYAEGTLYPWTMSDFSLMDAIECGIVKLPRVPIADNLPGEELPTNRDLWRHIKKDLPKSNRTSAKNLDPESLPLKLQTALEALYGHYKKTYELWQKEGMSVPPCFIVVCNNTSTSKIVYDYIAGYERANKDGTSQVINGRLDLFRNYDEHDNRLPKPKTLLIDSEQLESGEALDTKFREMASPEIELFKREIIERTGDRSQAESISDQDLLREVMNTVGKTGKLGESIRCVVSVSMLTEGWDANNVTHVLGVRAFGTQLLCEQVIGRALRRQSYELNEDGLFDPEYADVFGIPFDFTAKPYVAPPQKPRETIHVKAMKPERDHLEITFPRIDGYRVVLPEERLVASFNEDSIFELTPEIVGPTKTRNAGIIGENVEIDVKHLEDTRQSTLLYHLTFHLLKTKWRKEGETPNLNLFGQLKKITRQWLEECLVCKGSTYPAMLMYRELADKVCERITAAITRTEIERGRKVIAIPSAYNPTGSTRFVNFNTSKKDRWLTSPDKCHVNWAILDSTWEGEFCRVVEGHPLVLAYVKNQNLGLEIPYKYGSEKRIYIPDFIVLIDDGKGMDDPLHLIIEIKGYRREDAKEKKSTMETYWIPGVNQLEEYGRWAFAEFRDIFEMEIDFEEKVKEAFDEIIQPLVTQQIQQK